MHKLLSALVMLLLCTIPGFSQKPEHQQVKDEQSASEPAEEIPPNMTKYYMGIISRGPKWTPEQTPELEKLQEAHMGHIREMAAAKKLVIAGPFLDDGEIRGIFVFKVATLAEAKALANADPAVKAGRLVVEIHPWIIEKGVLP